MKTELNTFSELFKNFLDKDTGDLFEVLEIIRLAKGTWLDRESILENWVRRSKERGEVNANDGYADYPPGPGRFTPRSMNASRCSQLKKHL